MDVRLISMDCTRTEFVGTAVLDTIGLVIPGADDSLLKQMDIGEKISDTWIVEFKNWSSGTIYCAR